MTDLTLEAGGYEHVMHRTLQIPSEISLLSCGIFQAGRATRRLGILCCAIALAHCTRISRGRVGKVIHDREYQDRDINRRSIWEPLDASQNSRGSKRTYFFEAVKD